MNKSSQLDSGEWNLPRLLRQTRGCFLSTSRVGKKVEDTEVVMKHLDVAKSECEAAENAVEAAEKDLKATTGSVEVQKPRPRARG